MRHSLALVTTIALSCLAGWACGSASPPVGSGGTTADDSASGGAATGGANGSASGGSDPGGSSSSGGSSDSGGSPSAGGSESTGGGASTALETVTEALDEFIGYQQLVFSADSLLIEHLGDLPWGCDWSFAGDCRYASNCSSFP